MQDLSGDIDSGVDFGSLVDKDEVFSYDGPLYELKSAPIIQSPPTEVKHAKVTMRSNMKQLIMRQQIEEENRKELQLSQSLPRSIESSTAVNMPTTVSSNPEVPVQVLQVKTRLENPTRHYVQQLQKRQIAMYINQNTGRNPTHHSMPATMLHEHNGVQDPHYQTHSSSMPADPDSPLSIGGMSSTATSVSEPDDILGDILGLEAVDPSVDSDLNLIEPTLTQMSSTLPPNNNYHVDMYDRYGSELSSPHGKSSSSCPADFRVKTEPPPFLSEEDQQTWLLEQQQKNDNRGLSGVWDKEREKKDKHNIIERRRRFNINDRIKELGTLLPKMSDPDRDMRQNKGTILKASVDYIRKLKKDNAKLQQMEDRHKYMEQTNRKMMLRLQQLEMMMKAHGISNPAISQGNQALLGDVMRTSSLQLPNVHVKQEPHHGIGQHCINPTMTSTLEDMDDSSPVSGDPMLASSPNSSPQHSLSLDESLSRDSSDFMA